ncbi:methyl-accepting chemotaxis protein [Noviherbaspirillum denitrificans]|uniref:methyl-accepting chemotaxis protein n=1 Tax=Noviherbaspirillum denitrificans TaxID=1968433 RepID=UPI000B52F5E5|nr:methyl-accepting chemotaxis protein [Noviherbaspirillum denitrificans]
MTKIERLLHLNIAKKLWLLAGCATLGVVILTAVFLQSERRLILSEREASVRQTVEAAHGILARFHELAAKGAMSEEDAKRAAMDTVKALRYSGKEYFWINDMHPRMVMHPFKPEMDGTDLTANKDPAGKLLFQEMVKVVKADGAGFVPYVWNKPGSSEIGNKVSYVKGFAPWGWIIGSGVYMDSVQETFISRLISFSAGALVLAGILLTICVLIARSITRPLERAVSIAKTVAAGDLTSKIEVDSDDETGQLLRALRDMNDSLQQIVSKVREGTDTIAAASSQIASSNFDLAARTEEGASSLQETAAAMEELTSTVRQNADHASQANQLAASASQVAVKGGDVVSQVVGTMGSINDSARKIVDIIAVIDGIAFQTNILALNAAVEAARAGEQGKGFAVVASEVRQLAQRSAAAAREIKDLISDSVEKIDIGAHLVDRAGETMSEIVASVKRVTDIMGDISAASMEQSSGIEQVNKAIAQMDEVTQRNAALVEEEASTAESLQNQAAKLAEMVSVFRLQELAQQKPAAEVVAIPVERDRPRLAA